MYNIRVTNLNSNNNSKGRWFLVKRIVRCLLILMIALGVAFLLNGCGKTKTLTYGIMKYQQVSNDKSKNVFKSNYGFTISYEYDESKNLYLIDISGEKITARVDDGIVNIETDEGKVITGTIQDNESLDESSVTSEQDKELLKLVIDIEKLEYDDLHEKKMGNPILSLLFLLCGIIFIQNPASLCKIVKGFKNTNTAQKKFWFYTIRYLGIIFVIVAVKIYFF